MLNPLVAQITSDSIQLGQKSTHPVGAYPCPLRSLLHTSHSTGPCWHEKERLLPSPYVFKGEVKCQTFLGLCTHPSFAIGDEVDGEDILQMDPGRGELDVQSTDNY